MADEKILIQVDVDTEKMQRELAAAIKSVSELKEQQKQLTKEIEAGNDADGEMTKKLTQVNSQLEANKRQVKSQTALMQASTAQALKQNASLDEQRQYLGQLQKAYANLEGEAKELADKEGGLRDQIGALTKSVREQEHAIGDDSRNVGNYAESIGKAAEGLGIMKTGLEGAAGGATTLSKGVDNAGKVASAFSKNPIIGTLVLLTTIGGSIWSMMQKNEKAMTGITKLTAGFSASLDQIKPLLKWIGEYIIGVIIKAIDGVMEGLQTLLKWVDKVAAKFGKELKLAEAFEKGAEAAQYMSEEAVAAAEKAKEAWLAARKARIEALEEERKMTILLDEVTAKLNADLDSTRAKAEAAVEAQKKAIEQINKIVALDEEEEADEEEASMSPEEQARRLFGLDETGVEYFLKLIKDGTSVADAKMAALTNQSVRRVQEFASSMGNLGGSFADVSSAIGEFSDQNEAAATASKAFALGSIIANQAQSISEGALAISAGVAQAQSVPFPANIAAIVTTVATISGILASTVASFTQAKQLFATADSFSTGGVIGGYTSSPSATDNTYAHVGTGEMVLNANQQARLFDIANEGIGASNYEMMASAMAAAVASQPAPQLALTEFADAKAKVTTYQEIAAI